jgi:BSD domain
MQPIEEQHTAQYDKFVKKFSLSSQATDIAELLDAEVDVSRYYAELVPSKVRPEDFWAR